LSLDVPNLTVRKLQPIVSHAPSASMAGRRTLLVLAVLLASCVASAGAAEGAAPGNSELNAWARHNDDAARPALVLRPKYGLGNRMLSAISALALAVATDRRLFVEWEHPFEDLFISPFPAGWLQPAAELADLATSRRWHRPQTLDLTASSPTFSRCRPAARPPALASLLHPIPPRGAPELTCPCVNPAASPPGLCVRAPRWCWVVRL